MGAEPLGIMIFYFSKVGGGGTVPVATPVLDIGESINNRTKRTEIRYRDKDENDDRFLNKLTDRYKDR